MTVRIAQPCDRKKVRRILENGAVRFTRVPFRDVDSIVSSRLVLVAAEGSSVKGALISIWACPPFAWLDGLGVELDDDEDRVADALLDAFESYLCLRGVRQILCSMKESDSNWVREKLLAREFRVTTRFLRYEKSDFILPPFDFPEATLRSAVERDLPEIRRIEEACFEPPWRNDEASLKRMMSRCSRFTVALADRVVAGFQYSAIDDEKVGQFIHLAVDPRSRGLSVAKQLLADAIEFFHTQEVNSVETRTEQANVSARLLFTSFGFRPTGSHRDVFAKDIAANH